MTAKPKRKYRKFNGKKDALNYAFSYNDEETKRLHAKLNGAKSITADDLRQVWLWKGNRVLSVSPETLKKLKMLSKTKGIQIQDPIVKEVIERLVESQGIGFPVASAILKFINPEVFPIIDIRAYRALTGAKSYYTTYSYKKYIAYARQLSAIAKATGRPLREIDEQLYCFDEKYNKKI